MTGAGLAALVRRYTGTTSTTYTDANMLVDANNVKNQIAEQIVQRNENYFVIPSTDTLVADKREYAIPDDLLNHIFSVEVAFSGTAPLAYVKANSIHPRQIDFSLTEANITNYFSNTEPHYFIQRRSLYLLTGSLSSTTLGAATIASGIRLKYRLYPADLANLAGVVELNVDPSTTSFGMPKPFHELWARKTSIIYKSSKQKAVPLTALEQAYENDLEKALRGIEEDDYGASIIGSMPYEDGSYF